MLICLLAVECSTVLEKEFAYAELGCMMILSRSTLSFVGSRASELLQMDAFTVQARLLDAATPREGLRVRSIQLVEANKKQVHIAAGRAAE